MIGSNRKLVPNRCSLVIGDFEISADYPAVLIQNPEKNS